MGLSGYLYFAFTALMALIMVGLVIYFFSSKRKEGVEAPKYAMMEDDDED